MKWDEIFTYDPLRGLLTWKSSGKIVSCVNSDGYVCVKVKQRQYRAHRIIWDLMEPDNPLSAGEQIDHINHNRSDNRICNLRKVSASDNHRNTSKAVNNKSRVTGVSLFKRTGKWKVTIKAQGKQLHLGYFDDIAEAKKARIAAEIKYGFHNNHGGIS